MNFLREQKQKILVFIGIILVVSAVFGVAYRIIAVENTNIDATSKYAWSENGGWLNFRSDGTEVEVADDKLTGYVWSENLGWISLHCANSDSCATVDYGVKNDGNGNLSGYAWGENIGWVNFAPTDGGVSIDSGGIFSGYAWGENIGWVVFNCSDLDVCSASSFKVKTAWAPLTESESVPDDSDDEEEISHLDVSDVSYSTTDNSLTVTWKTNRNADSRVRWGTDKDLKESRNDNENVEKHRIVLRNLQPSTTYYFRVKSVDGNGKEDTSEIHSSGTKPASTFFASQSWQETDGEKIEEAGYEKVEIKVQDKSEKEIEEKKEDVTGVPEKEGDVQETAEIETENRGSSGPSLTIRIFVSVKNGTAALFSRARDLAIGAQRTIAGFFSHSGEILAGVYNSAVSRFNQEKANEIARINKAKFFTTEIFKRNDKKILAEVRFQILDKTENPIPNLKTTLFSDPQNSVTDENGIAKFKSVPIGEHTLAFEYQDESFEKKVAIADTMTEEGKVRMEVVEVKAQKEKLALWMWMVITLLTVALSAAAYFAGKYRKLLKKTER